MLQKHKSYPQESLLVPGRRSKFPVQNKLKKVCFIEVNNIYLRQKRLCTKSLKIISQFQQKRYFGGWAFDLGQNKANQC